MNIADVTVMDCSSLGVHPPYLEVSAEFAKLTYMWNTVFTIDFNSKHLIAIVFRNTDTHTQTYTYEHTQGEMETDRKKKIGRQR